MISSKPSRYTQEQAKPYQDMMDIGTNATARGDKYFLKSPNSSTSTTVGSTHNNNNNNNNNNNINANNYLYSSNGAAGFQVPYGEQLYSFASGGRSSYNEGSPLVPNMSIPQQSNQQTLYNLGNQQYPFPNGLHQDASTENNNFQNNQSFLGNNQVESSLPQLNFQQHAGLPRYVLPQQPQLEVRSSLPSVREESLYRTSRANSTTSVPARFNSRSDSQKSPDSKFSPDDGTGKKKSKRSRLGCLTCRHRKKRCCETKPRCTECSRLGLNCTWPIPGTEHKNRSKHNRFSHDEMYHSEFGHIKILRGVVEYKVD